MSITDELREWAEQHKEGWHLFDMQLNAIADRIDAEHERECKEQYACGAEHGIGASIDASMIQTHGYVELPKDADGEYIHEHDKVDWRDHAGTWHENATVLAVCSDGCYVMYALDGMVIHVNKSDIRHHHAPTVEDVLREFVGKALCVSDVVGEDELVTEYAAKVREVMRSEQAEE